MGQRLACEATKSARGVFAVEASGQPHVIGSRYAGSKKKIGQIGGSIRTTCWHFWAKGVGFAYYPPVAEHGYWKWPFSLLIYVFQMTDLFKMLIFHRKLLVCQRLVTFLDFPTAEVICSWNRAAVCWCTLVARERLGSEQRTSPTRSFGVAQKGSERWTIWGGEFNTFELRVGLKTV